MLVDTLYTPAISRSPVREFEEARYYVSWWRTASGSGTLAVALLTFKKPPVHRATILIC